MTEPTDAGLIGYLYCGGSYGDELADWEIVADQHQCDKLNEHHGSLGKEAKLPIYAAPQPTQTVPPAGREPLTAAQVSDLLEAAGYWSRDPGFINGIRYAEAAHGIKGGLHGAK